MPEMSTMPLFSKTGINVNDRTFNLIENLFISYR